MTSMALPPQPTEERHPLLSFLNVTRRFGGVVAVDNVSFDVYEGEVLALVGDNGAGKSTLMNMASGVFTPSSGRLVVEGRDVRLNSPADARQEGIETIYQDLAICKNLDAAANIFLGRELKRGGRGSRLNREAMREAAEETLLSLDIVLPDPTLPLQNLSGGQKQCVAIARAVHWRARLVIMDEPSAALGVPEQRKVADLIDKLRSQGHGVILVSHSMPEVFQVADRIVVMRRGRKVADLRRRESSIEEVVMHMVGTEYEQVIHEDLTSA